MLDDVMAALLNNKKKTLNYNIVEQLEQVFFLVYITILGSLVTSLFAEGIAWRKGKRVGTTADHYCILFFIFIFRTSKRS